METDRIAAVLDPVRSLAARLSGPDGELDVSGWTGIADHRFHTDPESGIGISLMKSSEREWVCWITDSWALPGWKGTGPTRREALGRAVDRMLEEWTSEE